LNHILIVLGLVFASICHAVGLGELKVYSFLDEPLVAEIEVLNLERIDPNQLVVALASQEDFTRAKVSRPYFLSNLSFEVVTYQEKVLILIRSSKVIVDPYIQFLLDLSWPDGSIVKDYTVLIDPPPKDFNYATRALPLSQLAAKEAEIKAFADPALKEAATIKPVGNKTQTSFRDQSINTEPKAADPNQSVQPTDLVPGVVPEVSTAAPLAVSLEYQKQLEEFKQRKAREQEDKKKTVTKTSLDAAIESLKETENEITPTVDVKHLSEEAKKTVSIYKDEKPAETDKIDFGNVIKPSTGAVAPASTTATPPIVTAAPLTPTAGVPAEMPAVKNIKDTKAPKTGGFPFMLLAFMFVLLVSSIFVVKKGLYRKWIKKDATEEDYTELADDAEDTDEFKEDSNIEEIELDSVAIAAPAIKEATDLTADMDLDEFEDKLAKLDLDEFVKSEPQKTVTEFFHLDPIPEVKPAEIKSEEPKLEEPKPAEVVEPMTTGSGLRLVPEGGVSTHAQEDTINAQIKTAKQYLDAGDQETAKHLLKQALETANAAQKVDIETILNNLM